MQENLNASHINKWSLHVNGQLRLAPAEVELQVLETLQLAHAATELRDAVERLTESEVELEDPEARQGADAAAEVRDIAKRLAEAEVEPEAL